MASWFEEEAQRRQRSEQPQPLEPVTDAEPEAPQETTPTHEVKTPQPAKKPLSSKMKNNIAVGAGVVALVGVMAWSLISLVGSNDTEVQQASSTTTSSVTVEEVSLTESPKAQPEPPVKEKPTIMQAGSGCGEETITADRSTLAGTIVAFEQAYYAKDADGLRRTLAKAAPDQQTDWETVLPEVVTDSMTWCAVVRDTEAENKADVDLTVKDGDKETTYRQTLTAKKAGDAWFIELIENREQS